MWAFYLVAGFLITLSALVLLRRELNRAVRFSAPQERTDWNHRIEELNEAFFDIANDLEGKYSVHEKQIADLEAQLHEIKKRMKNSAAKEASQPPRPHESIPSQETIHSQPTARASAGISVYRHGPASSGFQPADTRRFSLPDTSNPARERRIAQEARAMLQGGGSIQVAAKRLGVGVGELKLILDLYPYEMD